MHQVGDEVDEAFFDFLLSMQCECRKILKCFDLMVLPIDFPGLIEKYHRPALALAMDLLEEGSLLSLVSKQMTTPHSRLYTSRYALNMLCDIASALAYLHGLETPVVHRDVKLSNVLLKSKPRSRVLKEAVLADFGLCMKTQNKLHKFILRYQTGEASQALHEAITRRFCGSGDLDVDVVKCDTITLITDEQKILQGASGTSGGLW
jgi:serine/threonine protein kinase